MGLPIHWITEKQKWFLTTIACTPINLWSTIRFFEIGAPWPYYMWKFMQLVWFPVKYFKGVNTSISSKFLITFLSSKKEVERYGFCNYSLFLLNRIWTHQIISSVVNRYLCYLGIALLFMIGEMRCNHIFYKNYFMIVLVK